MEKKDLINVENAAIRAAGSRMAKMFQPMGEHEGDKEARRAFYEASRKGRHSTVSLLAVSTTSSPISSRVPALTSVPRKIPIPSWKCV